MKTILVGITGKAHSGKDTIGQMLWEDYGFLQTAFADPLKDAASHIFGLDISHFYEQDLKEVVNDYWGMSPRTMLMKLGTDACRTTFSDGLWVKRWAMSYESIKDTHDVVVTDVRFEDEAEAIRYRGGFIIHISRPDELRGVNIEHPSEAGVHIRDGDYEIRNDGTLDDLSRRLHVTIHDMEQRCDGR